MDRKLALEHIMHQYRKIAKEGSDLYRVELDDKDPLRWVVWLIGPAGTDVEGGIFKTELRFPSDFPNQPPQMRFLCSMFHPNVYPDGRVCISLLHPPGSDPTGYESAEERWNPARSIESAIVSVISILGDPNPESPANVDAARMSRDQPEAYKARVRAEVAKALEAVPEDFVPPASAKAAAAAAAAGSSEGASGAKPAVFEDLLERLQEFGAEIDDEMRSRSEATAIARLVVVDGVILVGVCLSCGYSGPPVHSLQCESSMGSSQGGLGSGLRRTLLSPLGYE